MTSLNIMAFLFCSASILGVILNVILQKSHQPAVINIVKETL